MSSSPPIPLFGRAGTVADLDHSLEAKPSGVEEQVKYTCRMATNA
jgi:hypothetical protein